MVPPRMYRYLAVMNTKFVPPHGGARGEVVGTTVGYGVVRAGVDVVGHYVEDSVGPSVRIQFSLKD